MSQGTAAVVFLAGLSSLACAWEASAATVCRTADGGAPYRRPSSQFAIEEARRLVETGEIDRAIRVLEGAKKRAPSASLFAFLAELQTASDRIPQAAESLKEALKLSPGQHRLRTTLGALYVRLRRYEDARRELERVLENGDDPIASYYLAVALKNEGQLAAARPHAERAAERVSSSPTFFLERSHPLDANAQLLVAEISYLENGDEAQERLRAVIELDSTLPSAHYFLAQSLLRSGKRGEAEAALEAFRRTQRAEKYLESGLNFAGIGKRETAIRELRAAIDAYPSHPRALYLLARQVAEQGNTEEAAELLRRILELEPGARDVLQPLLAQLDRAR